MLGMSNSLAKSFRLSEPHFIYLENSDVILHKLRVKYILRLYNSNCILIMLANYGNVVRLYLWLSNI